MLTHFKNRIIFCLLLLPLVISSCGSREKADLIILNAKIITVDKDFSIAEALAVKENKIIGVGTGKEMQRMAGEETKIIDANGKSVIPGLFEAHLHPEQASLSELKDEIPDVHFIDEVLEWISHQASLKSEGEWITFPKFFYTRLKELRPPTLEELDKAAPDTPVFLDGSYGGVINSAAMRISGITKDTRHEGILRDPRTGLPNGIIRRSAFKLVKLPANPSWSEQEKTDALIAMFKRYNRYGITSLCSGSGNFSMFDKYNQMKEQGLLTIRVFVNIPLSMNTERTTEEWESYISGLKYKTGDGDEWVKVGAMKVSLDGGILTGTAFLREPWGVKAQEIFGIEDPEYRGVQNYTYEQLLPAVSAAVKNGWKFTAHSTGGGGVDLLLDVYEEVNKQVPVKDNRCSIIHGNFFTPHSIERMSRMGVYADIQPAWFYKDADAMKYILGEERIKRFLPYKSLLEGGVIMNGGSDHMVKFDADKSINPYNPFLGIWNMVTRTTERGNTIIPEEAISREEALKAYTINNAFASFEEKIKGSLEVGKLADMVILTDDILTCQVDMIKNIEADLTIVDGKVVYSSGKTEVPSF